MLGEGYSHTDSHKRPSHPRLTYPSITSPIPHNPFTLQVKVLGEGYTPEDEEDSAIAEVTAVNVYQARYRIPVARAAAGNLVLIEGVDSTIMKTATLVAEAYEEPVCIFRRGGVGQNPSAYCT